jgi:Fe-S cluster assembly iron-binding protein IscA
MNLSNRAIEVVSQLILSTKKIIESDDIFFRIETKKDQDGILQYVSVFDNTKLEDDKVIVFNNFELRIDPLSYDDLNGSYIDFQDNLIGGFFLIQNPNINN